MADKKMESTKILMGALARMKPKPHEDMKLKSKSRRPVRRRASAKPKSA